MSDLSPANNHEVLPLVVYYHGGGWVMGNKKTHERLMRELCIGSGCAILFVNYLSSPEGQYPNVLEEGYDALEYVIHHAADYHVNPNAVLVAGDSVGGNMAAVLSLMSKERHGPALSKQILLYPVTDASMSSPSYRDFANGPWLTQKAMAYFGMPMHLTQMFVKKFTLLQSMHRQNSWQVYPRPLSLQQKMMFFETKEKPMRISLCRRAIA